MNSRHFQPKSSWISTTSKWNFGTAVFYLKLTSSAGRYFDFFDLEQAKTAAKFITAEHSGGENIKIRKIKINEQLKAFSLVEVNQSCWSHVGVEKIYWWTFSTAPNWACSDSTKFDKFETFSLVSNFFDFTELRQDPKMNAYVY